jgi:catechol 2,3-dioxygenase-like lactoylglutathione lyase family enzyme
MTETTHRGAPGAPHSAPTRGIYPVLGVRDVGAAARFFRELLELRTTFESDWYVSLATHGEPAFQLAVVRFDHDSVPVRHRALPAGVLVTVELDDVDAVHARALAMGVEILRSLRDEPWGQRHFIAAGPDGAMLDVVKVIPPAPGFASGYTG